MRSAYFNRTDLVFGDLRGPNIMVTKKGEVKLIDFNWAGIDGQAKYPSLITVALSMWPDGDGALSDEARA